MTAKERVRNDVLLQMRNHVDFQELNILENVLTKVLAGVEVIEIETLPATADDSNAYIWELFMLKKAPKLSVRTVERYRDVLRHFADHSHKPFVGVTSMDVELYLAAIRKDNTDVSLDGQRRCLSAFFSWMRKSHLIVANPCDEIEPYKIVQKPIDHMEPEEMEQLAGKNHVRITETVDYVYLFISRRNLRHFRSIRKKRRLWQAGCIIWYSGTKRRFVR